ncbi:hypothetical protein [Longirhabdus pacifica]|uniref:hypothetical protein n=1 Tax=Longirhabdus pacifica TaxID=2305227 RepID=UPI00100939FE|nr:hypothetical protein [Longirhabdus pacifica]
MFGEIREVKVTGMEKVEGIDCVTLDVDNHAGESWIVYVNKRNDGNLTIHKVVENNAEYALDWYNNDLHYAFNDMTHLTQQSKQRLWDELVSSEQMDTSSVNHYLN